MTNTELTRSEALALLKSAGLRRTFARIHLVQCLSRQCCPVTHAEVISALGAEGIDSSTIFRSLNDFVEAGLASRLDIGDHTWRYEIRRTVASSSTAPAEHAHFVCNNCQSIECLEEMSVNLADDRGHKVSRHIEEIVLKGLCETCLPNVRTLK